MLDEPEPGKGSGRAGGGGVCWHWLDGSKVEPPPPLEPPPLALPLTLPEPEAPPVVPGELGREVGAVGMGKLGTVPERGELGSPPDGKLGSPEGALGSPPDGKLGSPEGALGTL